MFYISSLKLEGMTMFYISSLKLEGMKMFYISSLKLVLRRDNNVLHKYLLI